MSHSFSVITKDETELVLPRIATFILEPSSKVTELIPVWESIILGSLLKLVRNRIRFNALGNFIQQKPIPTKSIESLVGGKASDAQMEDILRFGEGVMNILVPDKKSALALLMSQELGAKSSATLKGLTLYFALLGYKLHTVDSNLLTDWKTFGLHYLNIKADFNTLCPTKIQLAISDILLLSDILKVDTVALLSYAEETDKQKESGNHFFQSFNIFTALSILGIVLLAAVLIWYTQFRTQEEVSTNETEEIIPLDSLNKLNDSLTQAVLDSSRLQTDSLTALLWPAGKAFRVPKSSFIVPLHAYLSDSTQVDPFELEASELIFDSQTDALPREVDYVFKRIAEGLSAYKNVRLLIQCGGSDDRSALKHGFIVKNRLVGEGISPTRLEVKSNAKNATTSQIIFLVSK